MNPNSSNEKFLAEFTSESTTQSDREEFFDLELSVVEFLKKSTDSILFSSEDSRIKDFQEALDLDKAELLDKQEKSPLPLYLKNFLELSFQSSPAPRDSLVVKIAKDGLRLASAFFESTQFELMPVLSPSTRALDASIHSAFNLKELEKNDPTKGIVYQVIQENKDEAYLCINFSEVEERIYKQVNLRKNNRFIYSGQIDDRGIVSFSGLKEGKYNVEFVGNNSAKVIDLTILVDHL
ncbi:MAG: hypothetical protein SFU98_07760 [Leptospiraceae bacterium]|nr:hypothetical protein [Leptospiraceae bacterium]